MIRGNTSDFIGHPLPKDPISDPHMGPPTTHGAPGPPPSKSGAVSSKIEKLKHVNCSNCDYCSWSWRINRNAARMLSSRGFWLCLQNSHKPKKHVQLQLM